MLMLVFFLPGEPTEKLSVVVTATVVRMAIMQRELRAAVAALVGPWLQSEVT